jgi:hypothetical protein
MGRKNITGDEVNAHAKANGYKSEKKTAVETATSTRTTPRKIKMER